MIKIEDGRRQFYQWDLGQRLLIEGYPAGTEVHFATQRQGSLASLNKDGQTAAVVEIYAESSKYYADVPNCLLQTAGTLCIYIYPQNGDEAHTAYRKSIAVLPRAKPDDYIYTETEVKRWEDLAENAEKAIDAVNAATQNANTAATKALNAEYAAQGAASAANYAASKADTAVAELQRKLAAGEFIGATGPQGSQGQAGADGKSAYAYAVDGGYTGSEAAFAAKMASETSGIHVGTDAPTDGSDVWIDTDEEADYTPSANTWTLRSGKGINIYYNSLLVFVEIRSINTVVTQNDTESLAMPDGVAPVVDSNITFPALGYDWIPNGISATVGIASNTDNYTVRVRYSSIPSTSTSVQLINYCMFPRSMFNITVD